MQQHHIKIKFLYDVVAVHYDKFIKMETIWWAP